MLAAELRELESEGLSLALVGFSDDELEDLLASDEPETTPELEEEKVLEAPAQPVTQPGDAWQIGHHRLVCGDCRDFATVQRCSTAAGRTW